MCDALLIFLLFNEKRIKSNNKGKRTKKKKKKKRRKEKGLRREEDGLRGIKKSHLELIIRK